MKIEISSSSSSMASSSSNVHRSRKYPKNNNNNNNNNNKDMISELPDTILYHILSFLPTKDAVKTSILATNWRYLWTFLSFLHFENLSSQHQTILHGYNNVMFFGFLDFTSLSNLSFPVVSKITLSVPTAIHEFPSLHTLIFSYAQFGTAHSLQQFLSKCPKLHNLTLNFCHRFYTDKITIVSSTLRTFKFNLDFCYLTCYDSSKYSVEIDAVNLQHLTLTAHPAIHIRIVKPLTNIISARIAHVNPPRSPDMAEYPIPCSLELLSEVAAVKFLTLSHRQLIFWDPIYKSGCLHFLPEFYNLTYLSLDMCAFGKEVLMEFLFKCPVLEVLVISPPRTASQIDSNVAESLLPVPPCFKSSLKTLEVSHFEDGFGIEFLQFLLVKAILLNKIQITFSMLISSELNTQEKLKNQLKGFGRCAITYQ